ncbi:hypothetical protein SLS56_002404 [Neofusicoccum ribis]|uniref:Major facilitator superfamily (MFS) profile domain-containing protein n=1 Tax=Neofusicoccum ribis TaxID=45134 RepID=A0ABR3T4D2_9PEZI
MSTPNDDDAAAARNAATLPSAASAEAAVEPGACASAAAAASPENAAVAPQSQQRDAEKEQGVAEAPAGRKIGEHPGEPEKERSKAKIAIIMFALGMAVFLAAMDITIITTALPTISAHFQSAAGYTWIGSAFNLAAAASTPLWGKISDIFGRKPVLLIANVVFFIGSLIAALSVSIGMLIASRAIQGIGGGGLIILVNIVISDLFSMRSRGHFYINLPLDGLAFAIILFFLDVHTPRTPILAGLRAIDWSGSLAIVGGTLMLLLGLEFGGVIHPWGSATVVCLIVFGIVTIGLFLVLEWKVASYPIMPLRLFSERSNLAALAACFIHGFVFIAATYYLPLYYQGVRGAGPILSGVYLLAFALSLSVTSACTGIVIKKTGAYLPCILFGFTVMTLGYGLYTDIDAGSSWTKIILYQVVAGIGVGPNFQSPLIALQAHVHPRDIATATATFGFTRNLATAASVVVGGVVFQNEMRKRRDVLVAALGPELAARLAGGSAGANTALVDALPPAQRTVARAAFADSLARMWIMYVCFAGAGLLVSLLIRRKTLAKSHQEQRTGLENEERKRREAKEEAAEKRRSAGGMSAGAVSNADLESGVGTEKDGERGSNASAKEVSA